MLLRFRLLPLSALLLLLGCEPAPTPDGTDDLDHAEIVTPTGWRLRIYGDGSATLTHRQYPAHHLDYPAATFYPAPARRLVRDCRHSAPNVLCSRLEYYHARRDRSTHCGCAVGGWVTATMDAALRNMQVAVDDRGSERSCRMLRRAWLVSRY